MSFFPKRDLQNKSMTKGMMGTKFGAPPFSVLDTAIAWWGKRKKQWRYWLELRGELGRGTNEGHGKFMSNDFMKLQPYKGKPVRGRGENLNACLEGKGKKPSASPGGSPFPATSSYLKGGDREDDGNATSVFDPVLAELMYKWFCPAGGRILDPFAGEATKGIVASFLGYRYLGIELRAEQVQENERQAKAMELDPAWLQGDSMKVLRGLPADLNADMIFTSPPYYDLEVYSEAGEDGSAKQTYAEFMLWYAGIFRRAVRLLAEDRFLVVKVGEIRDKKTGIYQNFVADNIAVFRSMGLHYYNEMILVTAVGSLPVRAGRAFQASRKVGKMHQNVLCFFKGNPKNIHKVMGDADTGVRQS